MHVCTQGCWCFFQNQWISYGGLCGVCGDPYQQKPRDNEIGGKYASDIITRTYPIGGKIDVIVGLTANHMGYFEFKLCPILDTAISETQACMDNHQLKILNGGMNIQSNRSSERFACGDRSSGRSE